MAVVLTNLKKASTKSHREEDEMATKVHEHYMHMLSAMERPLGKRFVCCNTRGLIDRALDGRFPCEEGGSHLLHERPRLSVP